MDFSDYKMDTFIEKIVVRKKKPGDILQVIGISTLGILVLFASLFIQLDPSLGFFRILVWFGIFYGMFYFVRSKNIEYEYAVTNGDMDIDKITAQKKRKRIFSGHCRNYEIVAKIHSGHYSQNHDMIPDKITAVSSMNEEDVYFLITQYNSKRTIVYFQPSEKMLKAFRTYIPGKVMK